MSMSMTVPAITLYDATSPSRADILVGFGLNCYRFTTHVQGTAVDVLWATDGFESGRHRPSGSGIPLLFPFPGRIQGTQLHWRGKTYPLPEGDGGGNAIHGFVHDRPWRVLSQSTSHVTAQFQASLDDPRLLTAWPSDFCITATYRLAGSRLSSYFEMSNPGDHPLPCGFGLHPYFRLPLTPAGRANQCRLVLPVSRRWTLLEMNATGERTELPNASELQQGVPLEQTRFDEVLSGLLPTRGRYVARVEDPLSQLAVQIDFAAPFRECVVYTPDHRQAVCIEPYTCVPDPFRLQPAGVDAGLQVISPRVHLSSAVNIQVLPLKHGRDATI
jgi:aldose 1-epimerase